MRWTKTMLAAWLATAGAAAHAAADDEAWLLRTMSAAGAPGVAVPAERAQQVGFDALARLAGRRVRIARADGGEMLGVVERAAADTAVLRVLRSDGVASATIARGDVRTIRVD